LNSDLQNGSKSSNVLASGSPRAAAGYADWRISNKFCGNCPLSARGSILTAQQSLQPFIICVNTSLWETGRALPMLPPSAGPMAKSSA